MIFFLFSHFQTSSCFNSIESYPYESLDETRTSAAQTPCGPGPGPPSMADNNELTQSLPSCNNTLIQIVEPASEMELVMQDQHQTYAVHQSLLQQHQNYQIVMQQQQMQLQQQQQQNSQQGKNPYTFKTMMKKLILVITIYFIHFL